MIYITGDTHADFSRFDDGRFPQQAGMTKDDYVIITGDFGGVWDESKQQSDMLDWLNARPFTTLFITGNHENYDLLAAYPVNEWHSGKVQFIRPSIIHLMRGQVFDIDGNTFFTMGGAACHDLWNGVLDPFDAHFEEEFERLYAARQFFRIKHISWWEQELPTKEELDEGRRNLTAHDNKVDYVLTHCAPTAIQKKIQRRIKNDTHPVNALTDELQWVYDNCTFQHWFCGHYHKPMNAAPDFHVLYEEIIPLENSVRSLADASEKQNHGILEKIVDLFKNDTHEEKPEANDPE